MTQHVPDQTAAAFHIGRITFEARDTARYGRVWAAIPDCWYGARSGLLDAPAVPPGHPERGCDPWTSGPAMQLALSLVDYHSMGRDARGRFIVPRHLLRDVEGRLAALRIRVERDYAGEDDDW